MRYVLCGEKNNSRCQEGDISYSYYLVRINTAVSNGRGVWKRDARFGAGLEISFSSFGETSLVVLTHSCQMGNGGEAAEEA